MILRVLFQLCYASIAYLANKRGTDLSFPAGAGMNMSGHRSKVNPFLSLRDPWQGFSRHVYANRCTMFAYILQASANAERFSFCFPALASPSINQNNHGRNRKLGRSCRAHGMHRLRSGDSRLHSLSSFCIAQSTNSFLSIC